MGQHNKNESESNEMKKTKKNMQPSQLKVTVISCDERAIQSCGRSAEKSQFHFPCYLQRKNATEAKK